GRRPRSTRSCATSRPGRSTRPGTSASSAARACASPRMASRSAGSPRPRRLEACIRRPLVRLYHADGCHLCERARAQVAELRAELGFELEEVQIDGDPDLEVRYREWLPVVEIDGERAFVYYVQPDAFRRKVAAQSRTGDPSL